MPFTPTHIVAIVPIAYFGSGRLCVSALAIGSMIPDLPLFFPSGPDYETTHSLRGLVTTCLPLGLASYFVFQVLLKRSLVWPLPAYVRARLGQSAYPDIPRSWASVAVVALSVLLGSATHIVWDSFTHAGAWGVLELPVLDSPLISISGHEIRGYKLLQYGSTLVGLPLLALFGALWLRAQLPLSVPSTDAGRRSIVLLALITVPLLLGLIYAWARTDWSQGPESLYRYTGIAARATICLAILLTLAYGVLFATIARSHVRHQGVS